MSTRATHKDYSGSGSLARVEAAGIALADADSDDDASYHAARMRMRAAVGDHAPRLLGAKGGRASAKMLTAEHRKDRARRAAQARWAKGRPDQAVK